jgi:hypothetical protein
MSPVSILKTKVFCAKMIDLASYLEADNERLRQAAVELSRQTAALRQELKRRQSSARPASEDDNPKTEGE